MRNGFSFTYAPNLADVKFGIHLAQWGSARRKVRTLTLGFVAPAALMTACMSVGTDGLALPRAAAIGIAFGALWGVLFFSAFNVWLARTLLARQTRNGDTQQILVDADAVEHRTAVHASRVSWAAVTSVREFDRVFLLMSDDRPIGTIEKAGIAAPAELAELRQFIGSIKPLQAGAGLALGPI